jgi:hypothetical protein
MAGGVRQIRSPKAYYGQMSVAERQCRAGVFHDFPKLDPEEERLPAGYRVVSHDRHGHYHVEETCRNCGAIRPGIFRWSRGTFVLVRRLAYLYPADHVRVPAGLITPSVVRGMLMAECRAQLDAAAGEAEVEDGRRIS